MREEHQEGPDDEEGEPEEAVLDREREGKPQEGDKEADGRKGEDDPRHGPGMRAAGIRVSDAFVIITKEPF